MGSKGETFVTNPQSRPTVKITNSNLDRFTIMGICKAASEQAGWTRRQWDNFKDEFMDLSDPMELVRKHFNVEA